MAEEEEESEPAQWMAACDDCDNPVEHYCKTCGDKLCTGCKDHHLSRKKNRHHEVVPYSEGMRAHQQSMSTCPKHPSERLQVYCKPCQIPICTPCITESHSNHELISIADAFSDAKTRATSSLKTLLTHVKPAVKQAIEEAQDSPKKIEDSIQSTETDIKRCARLLHGEIDQILEENLKELHQMRDETLLPQARKQEKEVVSLNNEVETTIKKYENNLRSENPIDLIMFMKGREIDAKSCFPLPNVEQPLLPSFQPASISKEILRGQFGSLKLKHAKKATLSSSGLRDTSIAAQGSMQHTSQTTQKSSLNIMPSPRLEHEINIKKPSTTSLTGLCCQSSSSRVWIAEHYGKIHLADTAGRVIKTVDVGCKLYMQTGMYATRDSGLIFTDVDGKCVRKISSTFNVTTVFSTKGCKPYGLCLHNDEVLICIPDDKVVRVFTMDGQVIRDIGKGHFQRLNHVTVNRTNDDICVSDSGGQIVVFSGNGEKRFTYTGAKGTWFNHLDLCCDQLGNILITDHGNHRVHIIDRDGNFLQYLVSGEENISLPIAIDIDNEGKGLVGEKKTDKVKVFKYLN